MKIRSFVALLCAFFLIVAGCVSVPLGFRPGPSGDFVHIHSGMRFPKTVGKFVRAATGMFDGAGYDIGVDYHLDEPARVVMTVYVYPSEGRTLAGEFDKVNDDIRTMHPDAARISQSDIEHPQSGETIVGKGATLAYRDHGQELVSVAYLFEYGSWFLLYRATYEQRYRTESSEEVEVFMSTLSWPDFFQDF